jgi:hypothetical protein
MLMHFFILLPSLDAKQQYSPGSQMVPHANGGSVAKVSTSQTIYIYAQSKQRHQFVQIKAVWCKHLISEVVDTTHRNFKIVMCYQL